MNINKLCDSFEHLYFAAYAPGGGNVIKSLLKHLKPKNYSIIVEGPSYDIFAKEFKDQIIYLENFKKKSLNNSVLISSLSGNSDFEIDLVQYANSNSCYTICVLEHWVNYKVRFFKLIDQTKQVNIILPKKVWVLDEYALNIYLQTDLPKDIVQLIPNFYLEESLTEYHRLKNINKNNTLLYISEYLNVNRPNRTSENEFLEEFSVVEDLCQAFSLGHLKLKLVIRLHPYEKPDKYSHILNKYPEIIVSTNKNTLIEDLATAKVVLGIHSNALAIAALAKIPVFSVAKNRNILPINDINYVDSFQNLFKSDIFLKIIN